MINVVCIKTGTKYSAEYVNKLYAMVQRYLTINYRFICITDNPAGIDRQVKIIEIAPAHDGWWNKLTIFGDKYDLEGYVMYLDLDIVIVNGLDDLCGYGREQISAGKRLIIIDDWWQEHYNSSIMMFKVGTLTHLFPDFTADEVSVTSRLHGDQDWIQERMDKKHIALWPRESTLSYKYNIRGERLDGKPHKITDYPHARIVVFHGEPKPHEVPDDWIKAHWKYIDYKEYWTNDSLKNIVPPDSILYPEGWPVDLYLKQLHALLGRGLVLDFGCGYGRFAKVFPPLKYVGVDLNPAAVIKARELNPKHEFHEVELDSPIHAAEILLAYTVFLHLDDNILGGILSRLSHKYLIIAEILGEDWRRQGNPPVFNRELSQYKTMLSAVGYNLIYRTSFPYVRYKLSNKFRKAKKDTNISFLIFKRRDAI